MTTKHAFLTHLKRIFYQEKMRGASESRSLISLPALAKKKMGHKCGQCSTKTRRIHKCEEGLNQATHVVVSTQPEADGGDVEGVGDEVDDVPHVADVLLQAHVPQLLDLTPDQAGHPDLQGFSEISKVLKFASVYQDGVLNSRWQ